MDPPVTDRGVVIRNRRAERGSAAVEMVLIAPLLILVLLFVLFCGRLAHARLRVDDAAHQAARAASLTRDPASAAAAATAAAGDALRSSGASCATHSASVDTTAFRPGGAVTVTVSCTIEVGDLSGLHLPGHVVQTASSTSVVDAFRGVSGAGVP
jgi:Flp pilus assembly protein TadG